ncbi:MAG: aldehyde dehydrogenase (NADP(+)) [Pirellulales bacterium]
MFGLDGLSMIAGRASAGESRSDEFSAVNPATGEVVPPVYRSATLEQVGQAADAADEAFASYRNLPGKQRATFLRAIANNIEALSGALVERVNRETGLPETRVRSEMARTVMQLRMYASIVEEGSWVDARIEPAQPDRQPQPRSDLRSMLRPLGPVAVFGASNFPLAYSVAGGDTASALAAGCPVVVKAHPAHPGTSELVGKAIVAAVKSEGIVAGVFSLLFDAGVEVGSALVRHPRIKAVGFTGSLAGGRALFNLAAARDEPIPVYAEMGSTNPMFLLPRALATRGEQIAAGLHQAVTTGVGQFCTKPGIVLTNGDEVFRNKLSQLIRETAPGVMLHAGIAANYARGVERLQNQSAVRTLAGAATAGSASTAGAVLFETDVDAFLSDKTLADEVFGPATLLVRYQTMDELLAVARNLPGQLTVAIHGDEQDLLNAAELMSILETRAGRLVFNQFPPGVEVGDAIVHGGPYPATTDSRTTSVGSRAILRFARPVCFQNFPDAALPAELQAGNPLSVRRLVDGTLE